MLREPAQILGLLNRLRKHRTMLAAQVVSSAESHSTLVLGVDAAQGLLHLDALYPEPLKAFEADALIWLRGRIQGGVLRFRCRLQGIAIHDHGPVLRAALPETIERQEQRTARRLPIPETLPLGTSQLQTADGEHGARLVDISEHGAGAVTTTKVRLMPGTALSCRIELPGVSLQTRAEVRTRHALRGEQRLGLRFLQLGAMQEDRLAVVLNRLERQLIRTGRAAA